MNEELANAIWNSAIEAAALIAQPIPHIDEERTCDEVAAAIRSLKRSPKLDLNTASEQLLAKYPGI